MSALLRRVNTGGALIESSIDLAEPLFLREAALIPMTCTPVLGTAVGAATGMAVATTQTGDDAAGDGDVTTGGADDPTNNMVVP